MKTTKNIEDPIFLLIYNLNGVRTEHVLSRGSTTIGSSNEADITLVHQDLLPLHCQVIFWPAIYGIKITIWNLDDRANTYVNGKTISTKQLMLKKNELLFLSEEAIIHFDVDLSGVYLVLIAEQSLSSSKIVNDGDLEIPPFIKRKGLRSKEVNLQEKHLFNTEETKKIGNKNFGDSMVSPKSIVRNTIPQLFQKILFSRIFNQGGPDIKIDKGLVEVTVKGKLIDPPLSKLEFDVLSFLNSNNGNVCSKTDIAFKCWPDRNGDVSDDEIFTIIRRLRSKIEIDSQNPQYILNIRGFGYRLLNTI